MGTKLFSSLTQAQQLSRLALGTAQFGLEYGIANTRGLSPIEESGSILHFARQNSIDTLDTAVMYGDSERRLGAIGVEEWRVISKLPGIPEGLTDISSWAEATVRGSLGRLGVGRLDGLLLHRPKELLSSRGGELYSSLLRLKEKGLISKVGISIYAPEELDVICDRFAIDIVQAPFNILDRRLIETGWLKRLNEWAVEVHIRSIFLQGLLLIPASSRPPYFDRWNGVWNEYDRWLERTEQTALDACVRFALAVPEIDKVVVGVDSLEQLEQVVKAASAEQTETAPDFESKDVDLLNPSRWKLK